MVASGLIVVVIRPLHLKVMVHRKQYDEILSLRLGFRDPPTLRVPEKLLVVRENDLALTETDFRL